MEFEVELLSGSVPPKEVVVRYETTIERQLYRAVDQLERLQRVRGGEIVPPPINVQLNGQN